MPTVTIEQATEKALEQAKRAGVPMISAIVTSVTVDKKGDWDVMIRAGLNIYYASVSGSSGRILIWQQRR